MSKALEYLLERVRIRKEKGDKVRDIKLLTHWNMILPSYMIGPFKEYFWSTRPIRTWEDDVVVKDGYIFKMVKSGALKHDVLVSKL